MNISLSFWKEVFSPRNNQSWGRVAATVSLVFGIAWITRLIMLITTPAQFETLGSVSILIGAVTGLVSSLYGISKGLDWKNAKGVQNEKTGNPPTA